ncbi:hypothetical protein C8Q76DRAFT_795400 [Earliella scabrosa]|nr:hypothetical protein C8Q76DRAFT_795400 [Earliella scabrosa]
MACTCHHGHHNAGTVNIGNGLSTGLKNLIATIGSDVALLIAGFTRTGIRGGSAAALYQSSRLGGHTSGTFSSLQSAGTRTFIAGAHLYYYLPYGLWSVVKALFGDGENPELWRQRVQLAARGRWSLLKGFFTSSTFVDCLLAVGCPIYALVTGDWLALLSLLDLVPSIVDSVRRNFT